MAEALFRLKSAGGGFTWITGTAPITATGLNEGEVYEYPLTNGTIGEVTAGVTSPVSPAVTTMQSSVTQHGITFNFDKQYPVGQFANGEYFGVDDTGIVITSTTPAGTTGDYTTETGASISGRTVNGMVVNPVYRVNGFDSWSGTGPDYDASDDVEPGNNGGSSYTLTPGQTAMKAVSRTVPKDNARGSIVKYALFTCLSSTPNEGSFRAPLSADSETIPATWRLDQIDWTKVPSETFSSIGATNWSSNPLDGSAFYSLVPAQNLARNLFPTEIEETSYRREIGRILGDVISRLTTVGTQEEKTPMLADLIQIGIDQYWSAEYMDVLDPTRVDGNARWDIGRIGPTALAATLLPDMEDIQAVLGIDERWQDKDSYGPIPASAITRADNDTEIGAVPGMLNFPAWTAKFRENVDYVTSANFDDARGAYGFIDSKPASYNRIGVMSQILGTCGLSMFDGVTAVAGIEDVLRYNDRYLNMIKAGWPEPLGQTDAIGQPTGFSDELRNAEINYYDETKAINGFSGISALNLPPERSEPPVVQENGTQLLVSRKSPYVGHGAARTQTDLRYIELEDDGNGGLQAVGTWTEVTDVSVAGSGFFEINAGDPLGGLTANTQYAVAIRDRSANGTGAWSPNWDWVDWSSPSDIAAFTPWTRAIEQTTTQKAAVAPSFAATPTLSSYFVAGRPIRVDEFTPQGFPYPVITYQWYADAVAISGEEASQLQTETTDTGVVFSVDVTLTNTEGTVTETLTASALAAEVADTGYRATRWESVGNIAITSSGGAATYVDDSVSITAASFAFWTDSPMDIMKDDFRTQIFFNSLGQVNVKVSNSSGGIIKQANFGPPLPLNLAWYLVKIDMSQASEDKIQVWRKFAGSPYPAERLTTETDLTGITETDFRLARDTYTQTSFPDDSDGVQIVSDFWYDNVAVDVSDFWNSGGYPYDPETVGTPDVLLGGGSATANDMVARKNFGTGLDPLPAETLDVQFIDGGDIGVG